MKYQKKDVQNACFYFKEKKNYNYNEELFFDDFSVNFKEFKQHQYLNFKKYFSACFLLDLKNQQYFSCDIFENCN